VTEDLAANTAAAKDGGAEQTLFDKVGLPWNLGVVAQGSIFPLFRFILLFFVSFFYFVQKNIFVFVFFTWPLSSDDQDQEAKAWTFECPGRHA